ncbi:MAG: NAD(P)H-hydrate epimerase [Anaerolinea sp.]|nr:NAD(P)H-hydrate epimerase [Anaerolinea sp.]
MAVRADPGGFPQRRLSEVKGVTAAQMRDVQRVAQEEYAIDILQMTENAGRSIAQLALAMLGGRGRARRVVVMAGGGNKGAAGLAAARNLANWGASVEPVLAGVEEDSSFTARRQLQILRNSGIVDAGDMEATEIALEDQLARADLVIDALVGYGLEGPPVGIAAAVTELAVASTRPILAVDVPTGINATTGQVSVPAIRAITTLMLDLPKRGLLEPAVRAYVGELYLADLGIPLSVHERLGLRVSGIFDEGPIVRLKH